MTKVQEEVYSKIKVLLVKHFDGSVIIVTADSDDGTFTTCGYTGGLSTAIGA